MCKVEKIERTVMWAKSKHLEILYTYSTYVRPALCQNLAWLYY